MSLFKGIKEWIVPGDDENTDVVEEVTKKSTYETSKGANVIGSPNTKMVLFEPRSFDDAQVVAQKLKESKAVVVNLQKLRTDAAQRTIDFLTGVLFAIEGSIHQIGEKVFLFAPKSVPVDGAISGNSDVQE